MTKKFLLFFVFFGLTAVPVLADEDQGGDINQTDESGRLDVRLGLERRFDLGKKWQGNVALDGIGFFAQDKLIQDSGFDVITISIACVTFVFLISAPSPLALNSSALNG